MEKILCYCGEKYVIWELTNITHNTKIPQRFCHGCLYKYLDQHKGLDKEKD